VTGCAVRTQWPYAPRNRSIDYATVPNLLQSTPLISATSLYHINFYLSTYLQIQLTACTVLWYCWLAVRKDLRQCHWPILSGVARVNVTRCGPLKCHPIPPQSTSPPSLSLPPLLRIRAHIAANGSGVALKLPQRVRPPNAFWCIFSFLTGLLWRFYNWKKTTKS